MKVMVLVKATEKSEAGEMPSTEMLEAMGGAEVIGPVLLGMHKPVNVLQMGTSVQSIVNLAAITALRAQGDQFLF